MVFHKELIGKLRGRFANFGSTLGNIGSQAGSFVKDNPLLTGLGLGGIAGLGLLGIRSARRRKSAKRKTRRRSTKRSTRGRITGRGVRRPRRRAVIRGRGLGSREIKHSGSGTRGTKLVSFKTKDGRTVRFKVKGTSKRRRGFKPKTRRRTRRRGNISNRQ